MKKLILTWFMNILDFILHDKDYKTNFNYLTFLNLGSLSTCVKNVMSEH